MGPSLSDLADLARARALAMEHRHLAQADQDIAAGEQRIARQAERVGQARLSGLGTAQGEALLETLRQTLEQWQLHRAEILRRIAFLEGEAAQPPAGP